MSSPPEPLGAYLEQLEVCIRSAFDTALQLEREQQHLETELRSLKQTLADRDRRLASLRASLDEARGETRRLQQQAQNLAEENAAKERQVAELKKENEALLARSRSLEQKLAAVTERDSRDTAKTPKPGRRRPWRW